MRSAIEQVSRASTRHHILSLPTQHTTSEEEHVGRHSPVFVQLFVAVIPGLGAAQQVEPSSLPVITVERATVIAFWTVPASDAALIAEPTLAMALDDQQYYWAETRGRLTELGIAALGQPGRSFRIRDNLGERVFVAPPDSAVVGYLLVAPGTELKAIYRVHYPDDLVTVARSFFGFDGRP